MRSDNGRGLKTWQKALIVGAGWTAVNLLIKLLADTLLNSILLHVAYIMILSPAITLIVSFMFTRKCGLKAWLPCVMAVGAVVSAGVVVLTGYLMDRLHPLRVFVASGVIVIAANVWGYFYVTDYASFFVVGIAISVVYAVQFVSNGPVFIELFPPDKFGQFSSANAMMNSVLLIFANYFGGVAIDRFGYRFIFVWDTIFTVGATAALLFVYVRWKQLGGAERYTPPPTD